MPAQDDPSSTRIPGRWQDALGATFRGRTDPALIPGRMCKPISRIGVRKRSRESPLCPPHPTRGSLENYWKWRPK